MAHLSGGVADRVVSTGWHHQSVVGTQDVALTVDHHVWRAADALGPLLLVGMVVRRVHASARVDGPVELKRAPQLLVER